MESVFYHTICQSKFILKSCFSHTLLNMYISCSTKSGEHTWQSIQCHIENVLINRELTSTKLVILGQRHSNHFRSGSPNSHDILFLMEFSTVIFFCIQLDFANLISRCLPQGAQCSNNTAKLNLIGRLDHASN